MFIYYTGIGSIPTGIHNEEEFMQAMRVFRKQELDPDQLIFKAWNLPDDFEKFTLKEWIEYAGAEICL